MGKYTKMQLKDMANEFLDAEQSMDMHSQILMMHMTMITQMHPNAVHAKIVELANYEETTDVNK